MKTDILAGRDFDDELTFTASRSSGPGGQNVNKVSTRIELRFDVMSSHILNDNEKQLVIGKLSSKITKEGILQIVSQASRSQHINRERAREKFYDLIRKALRPPKKRVKTKPSAGSNLKRLEEKKIRSKKKELRKPVDE